MSLGFLPPSCACDRIRSLKPYQRPLIQFGPAAQASVIDPACGGSCLMFHFFHDDPLFPDCPQGVYLSSTLPVHGCPTSLGARLSSPLVARLAPSMPNDPYVEAHHSFALRTRKQSTNITGPIWSHRNSPLHRRRCVPSHWTVCRSRRQDSGSVLEVYHFWPMARFESVPRLTWGLRAALLAMPLWTFSLSRRSREHDLAVTSMKTLNDQPISEAGAFPWAEC